MAPRTRDELLSYGVMDPAMTAVSPLTYHRLVSSLLSPLPWGLFWIEWYGDGTE